MQKTAFLVELSLKRKGLSGLHFPFIRFHKGPFSHQLQKVCDRLAQNGFVLKADLRLTERGRTLADLAVGELREIPENHKFFSTMDKAIDWCKSRDGNTLIEYAYKLKVSPDSAPDTEATIRDLPMETVIIDPPSGGLCVPADLEQILAEQLAVTDEDLREIASRAGDYDEVGVRNVLAALNAAPPAV